MKRFVKPAVIVIGLVLAAVTVSIVMRQGTTRESAPDTSAPQPKSETGVLRYAPGAAQLAAIKVKPVEEHPVPLAEPLNGRVAYDENATARVSSPILGRVVKLKALPGDRVKAGDSLLELDSPDLAQAASDMLKARADEARKRQANERAKALFDAGVVPRKDYESAEADLAQAAAETQRANQRLRNLNAKADATEAGHFSLRAPIGGVIADRTVNPGMEVRPDLQNPLFVITDPARLWVMIDLPERNLAKVAVGHPVSVEVDAWPDQQFRGRIERIGETVDPVTRRIQVRCAVANPGKKLKPEMYARVTLLADEHRRAPRVPNASLITEGLYSFIFVEKEPGVFEKRQVRLSTRDRDYSYVEEGLKPGERIVITGPLLLNSELKSAR